MLLLFSIPLALSGVSYALFSQNLNVNGTVTDPVYVATQYLFLTYTKTITTVSGLKNYSVPMTVKNNGPTSVTAWQIKVDLPADTTIYTCPTSVTCTKTGQTLIINNGSGNGTIAKNATRSFTMSFRTAITDYTLQNVYISGTYIAGFQTITGLTVGVVQGTRTKVGSVFRWPVTFTVTNSSGFNLSAWQITVPWTTARSVISMPAGVTYTTNATQLLITSTVPINTGTNYVFTATLGSTGSNWTVTATVKGKP
jgi:hypothetical protein